MRFFTLFFFTFRHNISAAADAVLEDYDPPSNSNEMSLRSTTPPIPSVLNFDISSGRDSAFWGSIYLENFARPLQYFRAHFGAPPPMGGVEFVLASPPEMCRGGRATLENAGEIRRENVLVVERGCCSFAEKATLAANAGAIGILFVNNQDGNLHPSGPEAHDVSVSVAMVARTPGYQLVHALSAGLAISGRFVPMTCGILLGKRSLCGPVDRADENFVDELLYEGYIQQISKVPGGGGRENIGHYVQAEFGPPMPPGEWLLVGVSSEYACVSAPSLYGGEAVLVRRGGCDFATKAEVVARAGAGLLILVNDEENAVRMGVDPVSRGFEVQIPAVMVSNVTGKYLFSMLGNNQGGGTKVETKSFSQIMTCTSQEAEPDIYIREKETTFTYLKNKIMQFFAR